MRIGVLGPLEVTRGDGSPVPIPETKVRALLLLLVASEGSPTGSDRLAEDLWSSRQPVQPDRALRTTVSKLRGVLETAGEGGRDRLTRSAVGYSLEKRVAQIDAWRFRELVEEARQSSRPTDQVEAFRNALNLWRGEAFEGFSEVPGIRPVAAQLEEERIAVTEELGEALLDSGDHRAAVELIAPLTRDHPLRESAHTTLMHALSRAGRPAEALVVFERLRSRLSQELGTDPGPEASAMHRRILLQDSGLSGQRRHASAEGAGRTNVPRPPTETLGRANAVESLTTHVLGERLVTVVGTGGVGKTRLAAEAATRLNSDFPDGVWWVNLGDLSPEDASGTEEASFLAAAAISAAAGLQDDAGSGQGPDSPGNRLAGVLRRSRTLLVLDNCEHILDSVAEVITDILTATNTVHILATSREPLALPAEVLQELGPLEAAAAVRLFLECARRAAREPDAQSLSLVNTVCERLDALPLAVELAAGHLRTIGLAELAKRVQEQIELPAGGARGRPGRQRTLRSVVKWSWELLTDSERTVLRRLAVYSGGCTLDAAQTVCVDEDLSAHQVVSAIASLVQRSLLVAEEHGGGSRAELRYRLLHTVADYARAQLHQAGEMHLLRDRHLDHYLHSAECGDAALTDGGEQHWLRLLRADSENHQAAFHHAEQTGRADSALRLAIAGAGFLRLIGHVQTAHRRLHRALGVPDGSPLLRARAESELAFAETFTETPTEPCLLAHRVLSPFDALAADTARARAQAALAAHLLELDRYREAGEHLEAAEQILGDEQDAWLSAELRMSKAQLHWAQGAVLSSEEQAARALQEYRSIGSSLGRVRVASLLYRHARAREQHAQAIRISEEGLGLAQSLDITGELCFWLFTCGDARLAIAEHDDAERLFGEAHAWAAAVGDTPGLRHALLGRAKTARLSRRSEEAAALLEEWSQLGAGDGVPRLEAGLLLEQGYSAENSGNADRAQRHHADALAILIDTGAPPAAIPALVGLASVHTMMGDFYTAAQQLGAIHRLGTPRAGIAHVLTDTSDWERVTAAVRTELGEVRFAAFLHEGGHATEEQIRGWAAHP